MHLKVSHYVRKTPEPDGWIKLAIITRDADVPRAKEFYYAFEEGRPLTVDKVQSWEQAKSIRKLDWEPHIKRGQSLWISPEWSVWLASSEDPLNDRHRLLIESCEGRSLPTTFQSPTQELEDLYESEVAGICIKTGKVTFANGTYLGSHDQAERPEEYKLPYWQEVVKTRVLAGLQVRNPELTPDGFQEQEHRWPYIMEAIDTGVLALPFEMIFRTPLRSPIEIVQLASATHLVLVYVQEENTETQLAFTDGGIYLGDKPRGEWIRRLSEADRSLCTHGSTSAHHLIWKEISRNRLKRARVASLGRVEELVKWLHDFPEGVVICDVGIGYQMKGKAKCPELLRELGMADRLGMTWVQYPEPVPVGIAYKKSDERWGRFLRRIVYDALSSNNPRTMASVNEFYDRCRGLGMEPILLDVLTAQ